MSSDQNNSYRELHPIRLRFFETGNTTYAVVRYSSDGDTLLRWNGNNWNVTYSNGTGILGKKDLRKHPIRNNFAGEVAKRILLKYFGLEKKADEFTPEQVRTMNPKELEELLSS